MFKVFSVFRELYKRKLEKEVLRGKIPRSIMVVVEDLISNSKKFEEFFGWCRKFGVEEITVCVDCKDVESLKKVISGIDSEIEIVTENFSIKKDGKRPKIVINAGVSGRKELISALKSIEKKVSRDEISIEDVDEKLIEEHLRIKSVPDLIIKIGYDIPDFLIWQSIYSELYFLDTEWKNFRYIDFLRCLRDFQRRERRYGR